MLNFEEGKKRNNILAARGLHNLKEEGEPGVKNRSRRGFRRLLQLPVRKDGGLDICVAL